MGNGHTGPSIVAPREDSRTKGTDLFAAGVLSGDERDLMQEMLRALRTIRFGSISLTVHDGRLVEIQKTEKIRRKSPT